MKEETNTKTIDKNEFHEWLKLTYNHNTIKQYLSAYNKYEYVFIDDKAFKKFVREKINNPNANPFYKGFFKAVNDCFNLGIEIPKSRMKRSKTEKEYKFLTLNQIKRIIDNSDEWIGLLVRLFFETGLRLRELIDAEKKNIDLTERTIKGIGKGNKPFIVKFTNKTLPLVKKWIEKHPFKHPFHKDENKKDWGKYFWRQLKNKGEQIGIDHLHPHRIRHALGHYLRAERGWDLMQIKKKLRHSNLETTGIYSSATQKEIDDLFEKEQTI